MDSEEQAAVTHAGMGVAGNSTSGESHSRHPSHGKARTSAKKKERKKASALRAAPATSNALERGHSQCCRGWQMGSGGRQALRPCASGVSVPEAQEGAGNVNSSLEGAAQCGKATPCTGTHGTASDSQPTAAQHVPNSHIDVPMESQGAVSCQDISKEGACAAEVACGQELGSGTTDGGLIRDEETCAQDPPTRRPPTCTGSAMHCNKVQSARISCQLPAVAKVASCYTPWR